MLHGLSRTARNEIRKLEAVTLNAVALTFGGVGIIQPTISGDMAPLTIAKVVLCAAVGYICHRGAAHHLRRLED